VPGRNGVPPKLGPGTNYGGGGRAGMRSASGITALLVLAATALNACCALGAGGDVGGGLSVPGSVAGDGVGHSGPVPIAGLPLSFSHGRRAPGAAGPRRRELTALDSVEHVGVHGGVSPLGYFWAYVEIGTPPQKFSVILDTGSTLTAVPCANCAVCGEHMDPGYDPAASSTAHYIECEDTERCSPKRCKGTHCSYEQGYSEGSRLAGVYLHDQFWIGLNGEPYAVDFKFGCHDLETNLFKTQLADGIMGLAARDNTIVSVLQQAHQLPHFIFTLCLGQTGGQLVVGGVNATLHTGPMVYMPMTSSSVFYKVVFEDIRIDGTAIGAGGMGSTIVDSGTTFTYIPSSAYRKFKTAFEAACAGGACGERKSVYPSEPACFKLGLLEDHPDFSALPTMSLVFSGLEVSISPSRYLYDDTDDPTLWCVGILDNAGSSGSVIGANVMRGYDVAFDRENARIGWAPAICSEYDEPCQDCNVHHAPIVDETPISIIIGASLLVGIVVFGAIALLWVAYKRTRRGGFARLPPMTVEMQDGVSAQQTVEEADEAANTTELPPPSAPPATP